MVVDVDSPDEPHGAIDHGDLAVIAEIDLKATLERIGLSDRTHLHTGGLCFLEEARQVG